ncbi:hypothetical protein HaLaN_09332 [Haematococcus lacustris]|uniref:Uncharacterized protein n=1 Tax=Haematococcus lacustris TaxID=44745 RepID=A0A699YW65_HAELA|nr:hypothetical protein HaLaN_09332 [Haematococcus lacustris]
MNWNPQTQSARRQGLSLWNSGSLRVLCNNCFARMEAGIYFIMILKGTWWFPFVYVDYMKFEVYGSLRMSLDATVTTSTRVDIWSNPVILMPDVRVATITIPVSIIPVQISFSVGLQASCSYAG